MDLEHTDQLTRRLICGMFLKNGFNNRQVPNIIVEIKEYFYEIKENYNIDTSTMDRQIKSFVINWTRRWRNSYYNWEKFLIKNSKWLDQNFFEGLDLDEKIRARSSSFKKKSFSEFSTSQKNRATKELRDSYESDVLVYATTSTLRKEHKSDAAKVVSLAVTSADDILQAAKRKIPHKFSPEEAVAIFIINGKQSKAQYTTMRSAAQWKNVDIYPSYHEILNTKKESYPIANEEDFSETEAKVTLQNLVNKTIERMTNIVKEKIPTKVTAVYKWGMDGSSGHPEFKQKFIDPNDTDATVFCTNLVPLLIKTEKKTIWKNESPNSASLCRPIRMAFTKESTETIVAEYCRVLDEIQNLQPTKIIQAENREIIVKHEFLFTMINGKVINALIDNPATSRCPICLAGPKTLNNISPNVPDNKKYILDFGISPLHAKINTMQFLLNCAYRLNTKSKEEALERKGQIQKIFRERTGLIINKPKPGFGLSNDGNTARRFFENSKLTAEITNLQPIIIEKFSHILAAISCNRLISHENFRSYTLETAQLFKQTYPQFVFTPTVHKILYHGPYYLEHFATIPVGALSEEPQEARNKDFKKFRCDFSRKISRKENLRDVFNRFLLTSDPLFFKIFKDFYNSRRKKSDPTVLSKEPIPFLELPATDDNMNLNYDSEEEDIEEHEYYLEQLTDVDDTYVDAI